MIQANVEQVRARIAAAARVAGRGASSVRLIGITKGVSPPRIQEAIACGITEIGENRVQEVQEKRQALVPGTKLTWHMVGHLQRNKVKPAVELFDCVHSVDSRQLIQALDRAVALRQAQRERGISVHPELLSKDERPARLEVLIQVNVSGEATKQGCRPNEVERLTQELAQSKHLRFIGLMTMAPYRQNPEDSRPIFRQLRQLRDRLQGQLSQSEIRNSQFGLHLSMGMSQDFEVAIQEGATMVRIGSAIFKEGSVS